MADITPRRLERRAPKLKAHTICNKLISKVFPQKKGGGSYDSSNMCSNFGQISVVSGAVPLYKDANLSITTKRLVYQACVLSMLLYRGECWITLKKHQKRLNTFHHHYIHTILGITCTQQWEEHISSRMMREQWGDHNH